MSPYGLLRSYLHVVDEPQARPHPKQKRKEQQRRAAPQLGARPQQQHGGEHEEQRISTTDKPLR